LRCGLLPQKLDALALTSWPMVALCRVGQVKLPKLALVMALAAQQRQLGAAVHEPYVVVLVQLLATAHLAPAPWMGALALEKDASQTHAKNVILEAIVGLRLLAPFAAPHQQEPYRAYA